MQIIEAQVSASIEACRTPDLDHPALKAREQKPNLQISVQEKHGSCQITPSTQYLQSPLSQTPNGFSVPSFRMTCLDINFPQKIKDNERSHGQSTEVILLLDYNKVCAEITPSPSFFHVLLCFQFIIS